MKSKSFKKYNKHLKARLIIINLLIELQTYFQMLMRSYTISERFIYGNVGVSHMPSGIQRPHYSRHEIINYSELRYVSSLNGD